MSVDDSSIRSFIAIELPEEVKQGLEKLQGALKSPRLNFVRWVPAENIHVTLKFLGNISPVQINGIVDVMREVSLRAEPFELEVGGIGAFPSLRSPRVLWVGLGGDIEKLQALQASLEEKLDRLDLTKESRSFTPHLTIARLREHASSDQRRILSQLVAEKSVWLGCKFRVDAISLMKSQLLPSGAVYTKIAHTPLGADQQY